MGITREMSKILSTSTAITTDAEISAYNYLSQTSASTTYATKTDFPADAWTSYIPSLTASTTNPTLGTGSTATGRYKQVGKVVTGWAKLTFGTSGVNAGVGIYRISLPITAQSADDQVCGAGILQDSNANTAYTLVPYISNTGYVQLFQHQTSGATQVVFQDNPINIAASDRLMVHFVYEVA
jgi:hypothetical protein